MNASLSRRELLALLGAAGFGGLRLPSIARAAGIFPRWGLQLYTTRSLVSADLPGTLAAIAKIGYREVETAGYANKTPAEFRKALDDAGLTAPSAHIDLGALDTGLAAQLEAAHTIGHKWLVVPSLRTRTADGYKQAGETLAKAAAAAKSAGIRIGYHNHDIDFRALGDTNGMEILLSASAPDVAAELDVYWIVKAGGDPFDFIAKHPKRVKMLHLKDASAAPEMAMRSVGAGTIDWPRLLPRAKDAGVEHVFVEHDNPTDAIASITASFEYLNKTKGSK